MKKLTCFILQIKSAYCVALNLPWSRRLLQISCWLQPCWTAPVFPPKPFPVFYVVRWNSLTIHWFVLWPGTQRSILTKTDSTDFDCTYHKMSVIIPGHIQLRQGFWVGFVGGVGVGAYKWRMTSFGSELTRSDSRVLMSDIL